MKLQHTDHYDVDMENYQIDRFRGDWETYSWGKFEDFNLMLKGIRGDLYYRQIRGRCRLHLERGSTIVFLYVIDGKINVNGTDLETEDFYITDDNILDVFGNNPKIYYGFIKEWDQ